MALCCFCTAFLCLSVFSLIILNHFKDPVNKMESSCVFVVGKYLRKLYEERYGFSEESNCHSFQQVNEDDLENAVALFELQTMDNDFLTNIVIDIKLNLVSKFSMTIFNKFRMLSLKIIII